jgi:dihydroxy-acid dehydratase
MRPKLLKHAGTAVVFDDYNDLAARIDDEALPVDASSVLVLRNAGPLGGPGFPEWGMLPIPKKLLKQGVRRHGPPLRRAHERHQLRLLHPARGPRVFVGGPLALVQGRRRDRAGRPGAHADPEGGRGRAGPPPRRLEAPRPRYERGYGAMFSRHITQADKGCDFDFLEGGGRRSRELCVDVT